MDWKIIAIALLIGFVLGIIIGAKYVNTADSKITFRKVKVKGESNTAFPDLDIIEPGKKEKKKISLKKLFKRNKS